MKNRVHSFDPSIGRLLRYVSAGIVLACIAAFCVSPCQAQVTTETIRGTVLDISHYPVSNAAITFIGNTMVVTHSAGDGTFTVTLPAGLYRVVASAKGFEAAKRDSVLIGDQTVSIQITLLATGVLKVIANVSTTMQSEINVTPVAVTRLTANSITSQGSIGIGRVLAEIPGVQISATTGGQPTTSASEYAIASPADPVTIGIRGSQPYENAVLFDGHRINSNTWFGAGYSGNGVFNFADLDPYSFEAIDVVRGPDAASPTINNSIGGTANIDPGVPSGKPDATVSYGFDGFGGAAFNIEAGGETANKRLGLSVASSSATIAGAIGGFPIVDLSNSLDLGYINGQLFSCLNFPFQTCGNSGSSSASHVANAPGSHSTEAIACCEHAPSQDYSNIQQRSLNFRYDIAPTIELRIRYAVDDQLIQYNDTPITDEFVAPPGYRGSYPNRFQFNALNTSALPSHELDQLYEYDIRSKIGIGSVRISYASYLSTHESYGGAGGAGFSCNGCTISGEATVGGIIDFSSPQFIVGGTPTIFNDRRVALAPGCIFQQSTYTTTLTHDFLTEFTYPFGRNVIGLSYQVTNLANSENGFVSYGYSSLFNCPPISQTQTALVGVYENFVTTRLRFDSAFGDRLHSELALYGNQYSYHVPDPNDPTQQRFVTTHSYLTAPRFSLEWQPSSDVAVRASTGAGIAPVDVSNLTGENGVPQPNAQPPQYYIVSLANPHLEPEMSWSEDLGTSLRLGDRISTLSLDVYNTALRGQFFTNYQQAGTYLGLPLFADQTRNLGRSRYMGVEFAYSRHPAIGLFVTLQGSLQRGYAYDVPTSFYSSSGGPYTTNLTIIPNENFSGGMSGIGRVPYAQGFSSIGWQSRTGFSTNVNVTYYGNNNAFYRPPFFTIDLGANIPLAKRTSLTVAFANVTNVYPALFYTTPQFAVVPYVHPDPSGNIGAANAVQNVGPRHISATLNVRL